MRKVVPTIVLSVIISCGLAYADNLLDRAIHKIAASEEKWKLAQNLKGAHHDIDCVIENRNGVPFCLVHQTSDVNQCPSLGRGNFDEDGDWSECKPELRDGVPFCHKHGRNDCPMLATWTPPPTNLNASVTSGTSGNNLLAKLFGVDRRSQGSLQPEPGLSLPCKFHGKNCGVIIAGSLPGVGKTLVEVGEVESSTMLVKTHHTAYAYVDLSK